MAKDYIPSNQSQFNDWFMKIVDYLDNKTKKPNHDWPDIPEFEVDKLKKAYEDWTQYYEPTKKPHTKEQTAARNEARRSAEDVLRPFVQRFLKWPPVTDADRAIMGIPIRKTSLTPVIVHTINVEGILTFPGVHFVEVKNIHSIGLDDDDNRDKHGVRIHYGILTPASEPGRWRILSEPETGDDLPYSILTRRKKHLFNFEGESGNRIFICLCYENSKGERGPFGPMLKAVIP